MCHMKHNWFLSLLLYLDYVGTIKICSLEHLRCSTIGIIISFKKFCTQIEYASKNHKFGWSNMLWLRLIVLVYSPTLG